MKPLVIPRREERLRRDDIDRAKPGKPRQQVEIGGEQAVGFGNPVGNGNQDGLDLRGRSGGHQVFTQSVFVHGARFTHAPFVLRERGGEELGLPPQPAGAAIDVVVAQRFEDQLAEPSDRVTR